MGRVGEGVRNARKPTPEGRQGTSKKSEFSIASKAYYQYCKASWLDGSSGSRALGNRKKQFVRFRIERQSLGAGLGLHRLDGDVLVGIVFVAYSGRAFPLGVAD